MGALDTGRLLEAYGDMRPRGMTVHDRTRLIGWLHIFRAGCIYSPQVIDVLRITVLKTSCLYRKILSPSRSGFKRPFYPPVLYWNFVRQISVVVWVGARKSLFFRIKFTFLPGFSAWQWSVRLPIVCFRCHKVGFCGSRWVKVGEVAKSLGHKLMGKRSRLRRNR